MTIVGDTATELSLPLLKCRAPGSAIYELSRTFQRVPAWLMICGAAVSHGAIASVAPAAGIAFPHARLAGVQSVSFALRLSDTPIPRGVETTFPVNMVFMLAASKDDMPHYLPMLPGLVRLAKNSHLMDALRSAADSDGILAVLRAVPGPAVPRHCPRPRWRMQSPRCSGTQRKRTSYNRQGRRSCRRSRPWMKRR